MAIPFANVALSDTFDTWRIRTNQILTDAVSTTAPTTTVAGNVFFTATTTTQAASIINATVVTQLNGNRGVFSGLVTAPTVNANTLGGTISTASQPNITGVGALNSGSISTGFGAINVGTDNITGGTITGTSLVGTISTASQPNITGVGALNSGSITTGFGSINVGTDGITGGVITGTSLDINGSGDVSGSFVIHGDLTVNGNTITVNTQTLSVEDNIIYVNANAAVANPDLGWVGGYNDGVYGHAGVFRDASDQGTFKFFHEYTPEPDASPEINTAHASFKLANVAMSWVKPSDGVASNGPITAPTVTANTFTGNIVGANNTYTNLHPVNTTFTTAIDFNQPLHTQQMGANRTITFSNVVNGRQTVVYLDRSASNYTPTWPTVKWSADTEPTWSDYRHWVVNLFVRIDGAVCGSATGHVN